MNDIVSDFLTRVRNAVMAEKKNVRVKASGLVEDVANIFKNEGIITSITRDGYYLDLVLKGSANISTLRRISKPSIRRYVKYTNIPRPHSGFGTIVLSTPKGVMTGRQAHKQKVGGELICEVW